MNNALILDAALEHAKAQFEYRQRVVGHEIPHDPDWRRVMGDALKPALEGERGDTDQQECAYQAIRITLWESGVVRATWSRAFPRPQAITVRPSRPEPAQVVHIPIVWYRRWWAKVSDWYQAILKQINDWL